MSAVECPHFVSRHGSRIATPADAALRVASHEGRRLVRLALVRNPIGTVSPCPTPGHSTEASGHRSDLRHPDRRRFRSGTSRMGLAATPAVSHGYTNRRGLIYPKCR